MKKRTIFTLIFVLFAAAAIAAGFYLLAQKQKNEQPVEPQSVYNLADEAYFQAAQQPGVKLYESDIDGLFYSLSPLQYYLASEQRLEPIEPSGEIKTAPVVAGVKMSLTLHYVQRGGQLFGLGIWHSDSGIYNDAFAVMKRMPKGFASSAPYLLLIDTSSSDLSATQREYSEFFSMGKGGSIGGYLFDQRNRTVEQSGKLRTDWNVMNLRLLALSQGETVYSLSGKKYNRQPQNQTYDFICTKGGVSTVAAKGVSDLHFSGDGNAVRFVRLKKSGWNLVELKGGKQSNLAHFESDAVQDYTFSANAAVNKNDNAVLDLQSGESEAAPAAFKKLYALEKTGTKTVCVGKEQNRDGEDFKVQKIVIADDASAAKTLYANDIMDENTPLFVCTQGIVTSKDAKSVFISYTALESLMETVVK